MSDVAAAEWYRTVWMRDPLFATEVLLPAIDRHGAAAVHRAWAELRSTANATSAQLAALLDRRAGEIAGGVLPDSLAQLRASFDADAVAQTDPAFTALFDEIMSACTHPDDPAPDVTRAFVASAIAAVRMSRGARTWTLLEAHAEYYFAIAGAVPDLDNHARRRLASALEDGRAPAKLRTYFAVVAGAQHAGRDDAQARDAALRASGYTQGALDVAIHRLRQRAERP
jgi:hypothetical protein